MIRRDNCYENRTTMKSVVLHKDGFIQKCERSAVVELEHFDLPYGTELSYDWSDSKDKRYTIVREPGRFPYAADAKIMFIV